MRDEPDPPRKFYQLKPKEFEAINPPTSAAPADATPTDVRGHLRAAFGEVRPAPKRSAVAPTEAQAILSENHQRATAAGLNEVSFRKRRSRRKRDYWLLFLTLNAFFAFVAFGPYRNPMTLIYGVAGMIIFSLGLTWVMWFVMDDY